MAIYNPRHPHTCKIYRESEATPFEDGVVEVLYEGKCRKYGNTTLRTFKTDNVMKSDYALSVPGQVRGIRSGDKVDVTDLQGEFVGCIITDAYAGNIGTNVYFNLPKT